LTILVLEGSLILIFPVFEVMLHHLVLGLAGVYLLLKGSDVVIEEFDLFGMRLEGYHLFKIYCIINYLKMAIK